MALSTSVSFLNSYLVLNVTKVSSARLMARLMQLKIQGIVDILDIDSVYPVNRQRAIYPRTIFLLENGTFYETKVSRDLIFDLSNEWDSFRRLQPESKELILEALREIGRPSMLVRYRSEHIEDYVDRIRRRESDGEEG